MVLLLGVCVFAYAKVLVCVGFWIFANVCVHALMLSHFVRGKRDCHSGSTSIRFVLNACGTLISHYCAFLHLKEKHTIIFGDVIKNIENKSVT